MKTYLEDRIILSKIILCQADNINWVMAKNNNNNNKNAFSQEEIQIVTVDSKQPVNCPWS